MNNGNKRLLSKKRSKRLKKKLICFQKVDFLRFFKNTKTETHLFVWLRQNRHNFSPDHEMSQKFQETSITKL